MMEQLKQKWSSMPVNDRRIYSILCFVVVVAIIYSFIWLPSQQARTRLDVMIQQKKSQLAQMRMQSEQIKSLQSAIKLSHSSPEGLKSAVETSGNLHNMTSKIGKIESDAQGAISISLPKVGFDEWIGWIAALQSDHHVRVAKCEIVKLNNGVTIEATLVAE